MGGETSREKSAKILNITAKNTFLCFLDYAEAQPEEIRSSAVFKKMLYTFYKSLKNQPQDNFLLSLFITGNGIGTQFIRVGLNFLKQYPVFTKISFSNSGLTINDIPSISKFISSSSQLSQIDFSENKIGSQGVIQILNSCINHPRIESIILDKTQSNSSILNSLINLFESKTKLKMIRIIPLDLNNNELISISKSLKNNYSLTELIYNEKNDINPNELNLIFKRNKDIQLILDELITSPFHRNFRKRQDIFKSVKGRRLVEGKARQMDNLKGMDLVYISKALANNYTPKDEIYSFEKYSIGLSETIGRREKMEDVSIAIENIPLKGDILVAIFDGHGGKEASEYAGLNFSEIFRSYHRLSPKDGLFKTFKELQNAMEPWSINTGTTAVIAHIRNNHLTVANVGDSRCVISQNGNVKRLTIDHKPSNPEEQKYIESMGGNVQEGRLNGIISVSRALGDSYFGNTIKHEPTIIEEEINEKSFILLACDGVWDVLSDEKAIDLIKSEIDPMSAAKQLKQYAFENGSEDNISVATIFPKFLN